MNSLQASEINLMLPKSKIRLSRRLRAQTTPYPDAGRWLKRGAVLLVLLIIAGIYLAARPERRNQTASPQEKEILGEQDRQVELTNYTVKAGDTLFTLSQRFSVDWQELAALNNLQEPFLLRVGQELKIPR